MYKKIHKSKWCKNAVKTRIQEHISTYNNLYKITSFLQNCKISERIWKECFDIVYVVESIGYYFVIEKTGGNQYGSFAYRSIEEILWK